MIYSKFVNDLVEKAVNEAWERMMRDAWTRLWLYYRGTTGPKGGELVIATHPDWECAILVDAEAIPNHLEKRHVVRWISDRVGNLPLLPIEKV